MRPLRWIVGLVMLATAMGLAARAAELAVVEARMKKDIAFLASDECEGRGVSTKGINRAADYIAEEFKKAGLQPAGTEGTWFQPFTMSGTAKLDSPNTLKLIGPLGQEIELRQDRDFRPLGMSTAGTVCAPVVFVGYGATAKDIDYDDFKGVDVAGKIILMIRKTPLPDNMQTPFDGKNAAEHAALKTKLANAVLNKAAAVLLINDRETARNGDPLMPFNYTATAGTAKLPAVHMTRSTADAMLQSGLGVTLKAVEEDIDRDLKPQSAPLKGWTGDLQVSVKRPTIAVKNVIGVLDGAGPLAKETVVIGAHYDHLGYGGAGSLAKDKKPAIHYGADDNGSGTTTLIELARRFGEKPRAGRRLVFIAFSAEESGLLGSEHYVNNPRFPLADTVAMINLDMVGRLRPDKETNKNKLIVYGTGTAKTFDKLIDELNQKHDFKLSKVAGGMGPSDHASFYIKKIPVFFFFTGEHAEYHKPSDTADLINLAGMRRIADLVEDVASNLAAVKERPEYVAVKDTRPSTPRYAMPTIGMRPSYGDDKEGVLLGGVTPGGPADKAGLKEGDRILEVAGKPVKDLETYMVLMTRYKKGDTLDFGVLRGSKKLTLKVKTE
jgi:hypothetical protein